ncbi:hypothetical protein CKM354_000986900 [Cercospora kikuchii]|uniref:Uncharacterized protein n=1 Tax=Cercospora kikuchii TaxID=84275 RepID=A0A9P3FGR7_9PEZI|nr:uncharacterized protein CKM354_000986900 [Cercospora kikuchii]GIZ46756.1 hypothetical protein CKM354_000986900 [Cercospora kikuchii]
MATHFIAQLLAAAGNLSVSELETASCRLIEIRNSKTPLFRLPGELRNRIWRMALIEDIRAQEEMYKEKAQEIEQERREGSGHVYEVVVSSYCHRSWFPVSSNKRQGVGDFSTTRSYFGQFHRLQETIVPPTFFNACRQMKNEVEPILYSHIMVWQEYDRILRRWKTLQPHQTSGLFRARQNGLPLLKAHHGCCHLIRKEDFEASESPEVLRYAHVRKGIVRFAEELEGIDSWLSPGQKDLVWTIGAPPDATIYRIVPSD